MRKIIKICFVIIAFISFSILTFTAVTAASLPDSYKITSECSLDIKSYLRFENDPISVMKQMSQANSDNSNNYSTNIMFMNIIPIKKVNIQRVEDINVIPCGTPFGVKLFTKGVIIVGLSDIKTGNGLFNPAKQAGLQKGDVILSINKNEVNSNEELIKIIRNCKGNELELEIIRNGINYITNIKPLKSDAEGLYKLGIWVRDSSAGIGTITFMLEKNKLFAGLGHGICDIDTGELLPLSHGDIIKSSINGISKGIKGNPGELKGYFIEGEPIGTLFGNTFSGIYGQLNEIISDKKPIPVAMKQQIKTGPAQILATIFGSTPEYYTVDIVRINYNEDSPSKNMIIKIDDKKLLDATGGIIQGMSGSPIIQDGRMIGAITHVFVNDPQKGYAIFAENMISELQNQTNSHKKAS